MGKVSSGGFKRYKKDKAKAHSQAAGRHSKAYKKDKEDSAKSGTRNTGANQTRARIVSRRVAEEKRMRRATGKGAAAKGKYK